MGYRYPNEAFSVILNINNNPWGEQNVSQSYNAALKEKTGFDTLDAAFEQAKERVQTIITQQQNYYTELEKKLQARYHGATPFNLQQALNDSLGTFTKRLDLPKTFTSKDKAKEALKKAQTELRNANIKFRMAFQHIIASAAKIKTSEDAEECFNKAEEATQKLLEAFERARQSQTEIGKDVRTRIDRISGKAIPEEGAALSDQISFTKQVLASGEISFSLNGDRISEETRKKFQEYINLLNNRIGKGRGYRKGRKGGETSFNFQWRKIEAELTTLLARDLEEQEESPKVASIIESMIEMFATGEVVSESVLQEKTQLAQESGYILESVANLSLQDFFKDPNVFINVLVSGGSVTKKTRIMLRFQDLIGEKDKKKIEEALKETSNELAEEYYNIIETFQTLDKIDDFITFDFKEKDNTGEKYTIAFSDKLYKGVNNISILTGTRSSKKGDLQKISGASTLLNSYDLISKAGPSADAFVFTALNSSKASIFYKQRPKVAEQLKELLMTFIYEMAYNPTSFVEQVLESDIENTKVVYFHRIGARTIPSFLILKNILKALDKAQEDIETEPMVKINLAFDNTHAKEYIKALNNNPENFKDGNSYNQTAWAYVATQVANNTLMNVHLNLLPAALDITGNWIS